MYIDNLITTFDSERTMIDFYHDCKAIMSQGNFNMREWSSNSEKFMNSIPDNDKCAKTNIKVLGVKWDTQTDLISVNTEVFSSDNEKLTKRSIVQNVSKIFDPFGFLLPLQVKSKLLIQDIWKAGFAWDENLPADILDTWRKFKEDFSTFSFKIERPICSNNPLTLHVFSDSSSRCFGAVAYVTDCTRSWFLLAKSRLAPIKAPKLPQLELTALNLAARLVNFVVTTYSENIQFSEVVMWSDSEITLHWVTSTKDHKRPYVRQRVADIRTLCPTAIFRHIPGKLNPGDLLTRGINSSDFRKNQELWLHGPPGLANFNHRESDNKFNICHALCTALDSDSISCNKATTVDSPLNSIIPVDKYGSYRKCLRVTALVCRYIYKLKSKISTQAAGTKKFSGYLRVEELKNAENLLLSLDQKIHFPDIIDHFAKATLKKPQLVHQLNLKYNGMLVRSYGRMQNSTMSDASKYPILISPKSKLTRLIIQDAHRINMHCGTNHVLNYLRSKFWIPRGRQTVKSTLRACVTCKKVQGRPYAAPPEPPLPANRVCEARPFQITGVDLTGAIMIKDNGSMQKAYIALFTCAVTRAIHLEVIYSLSEDEFLRAFIRFSSRRSLPQCMYSDNAKNFEATANTLRRISDSKIVVNHMVDNHVDWKFITPRAAWHGAIWERLIGLTKSVFKKVIGKAMLSKADIETIVPQIEAVLNDRPLTYVNNDVRDFQPLTPSQLIFGHKLREFPNILDESMLNDPNFASREILSKMFVHRTKVLSDVIKRWKHEYLASLRERPMPNNRGNDINLGHIVLVHDDLSPRSTWKMGIVTKLLHSLDSRTRSVQLKTNSGYIIRPVTKLYPLEISCIQSESTGPVSNAILRPQRLSAIKARNQISNIVAQDQDSD